ncbi:protein CBFA2T2-like isoform X2 [Tachypleus tridentatus]|uniref:protein CBFA2T2-like isoform X2 n=1 Tax=Tachypleus tridentatus TaxID=6853 RepID=UPI003FD10DDB
MPDSVDNTVKQARSGINLQVMNQKLQTVQALSGTYSLRNADVGAPSSPTSLPLSTTVVSLSEAPLACNILQLSKLKRFLTTLEQFGSDISPEVGENVHNLILGLVNSSLSVEEFHRKVQVVTGYRFRPFVVPFLKSHLPMLQIEVLHFARLTKQTPQQYLKQHKQAVLDSVAHPSGEPFEIFQPESKENRKRRTLSHSGFRRPKENEFNDTSSNGPVPIKRHHSLSSSTIGPQLSPTMTTSEIHSNISFRFEDSSSALRARDPYDHYKPFQKEVYEERDMEDEWRNIHTMLNCILGMVDKTKRALTILQKRSHAEWNEYALWTRRQLDGGEFDLKKQRSDILTKYRSAEERVTEVRRRAEEAVNEVKRQAVVELQKAVSVAESEASELVAVERAKMEKLISEARRQGSEEALTSVNHQEGSTENCWNCGRKARETCSGCNTARYCGSFCQHRDWENHLRICGKSASKLVSTTTVASRVVQSSVNSIVSTVSSTNNGKTTSPTTSNWTEEPTCI